MTWVLLILLWTGVTQEAKIHSTAYASYETCIKAKNDALNTIKRLYPNDPDMKRAQLVCVPEKVA